MLNGTIGRELGKYGLRLEAEVWIKVQKPQWKMNCSDEIYQMRYRIDNMSEMLKNNTNFKSRERRNIF